eukprot:gene16534-20912_t
MNLAIELSAVVVTVKDNEAFLLCLKLPKDGPGPAHALPSGPFVPENHRTFDLALRAFVQAQTGFDIGYVEQLYSFGDDGRQALVPATEANRIISVGYLALTPQARFQTRVDAEWLPFHHFFPWEDWRNGDTNLALNALRPPLADWCAKGETPAAQALRRQRIETLFPIDFDHWNEERVLDRYELLYDAGLTGEQGARSGRSVTGHNMASDHRRIAAT